MSHALVCIFVLLPFLHEMLLYLPGQSWSVQRMRSHTLLPLRTRCLLNMNMVWRVSVSISRSLNMISDLAINLRPPSVQLLLKVGVHVVVLNNLNLKVL